jgi:hypothetical protein
MFVAVNTVVSIATQSLKHSPGPDRFLLECSTVWADGVHVTGMATLGGEPLRS